MKFLSPFKSHERSSAIVHDFQINPLADEGTLGRNIPFQWAAPEAIRPNLHWIAPRLQYCWRQGEKSSAVDKRKNWYSFIVGARACESWIIRSLNFAYCSAHEYNWQKVNNNWIIEKKSECARRSEDYCGARYSFFYVRDWQTHTMDHLYI